MLSFRKTPSNFIKESELQLSLFEEIEDNSVPQFAIISPDGTQIGNWMNCKDFIQDTIWGSINNVPYKLYGWRFNPQTDKTSSRYLLLALRWTEVSVNKLKECLFNVKATVEGLEKKIGIPKYLRTRFSRVINRRESEPHFVIYGSPLWLRCIGTVSFFSWLIRASLNNKGGKLETIANCSMANYKDAYYIKSGEEFIRKLLDSGIDSFEPDWHIRDVSRVHHNGFVQYSAFIRNNEKPYKDSWLNEDWKLEDIDDNDGWDM